MTISGERIEHVIQAVDDLENLVNVKDLVSLCIRSSA
jgi:hypothetical protein